MSLVQILPGYHSLLATEVHPVIHFSHPIITAFPAGTVISLDTLTCFNPKNCAIVHVCIFLKFLSWPYFLVILNNAKLAAYTLNWQAGVDRKHPF